MKIIVQVEVTKFDELEEVHAELKLKELLWNSLDEWDTLHDTWLDAVFEGLDPEAMNVQASEETLCWV